MVTKAKDHWEFQYWCPRVQKNKKWKSSYSGNRSYQLTHAGRPAKQGQIGQHWSVCNSNFHMGGFSFLVFLNPWASILKFSMVFCFCNHFLFKSILVGGGAVSFDSFLLVSDNVMGPLQEIHKNWKKDNIPHHLIANFNIVLPSMEIPLFLLEISITFQSK